MLAVLLKWERRLLPWAYIIALWVLFALLVNDLTLSQVVIAVVIILLLNVVLFLKFVRDEIGDRMEHHEKRLSQYSIFKAFEQWEAHNESYGNLLEIINRMGMIALAILAIAILLSFLFLP